MPGIYIHIPFCIKKCIYCDFYSKRYNKTEAKAYAEALIKNIKSSEYKNKKADTVYFGGGTPSVLDEDLLIGVLNAVFESFDVSQNAEITFEANPGTADFNKLSALRKAGFNRVSFGVQSAVDSELSALSRIHSFDQAKNAVTGAYKAGFENISCDLMLGIPGQTKDSLIKTLTMITDLPAVHISAYILKVEKSTPLFGLVKSGVCKTADGDSCADLYEAACSYLLKKGFEHYEISNFAKPGFESRHNLKYWRCEEYLGFGPYAHSYISGKRFYNDCTAAQFINGDINRTYTDENTDKAEEYIIMSLRLSEGLSLKKLKELDSFGRYSEILDSAGKLNRLCGGSIFELSDDKLRLTEKGFLVSNEILSRLI